MGDQRLEAGRRNLPHHHDPPDHQPRRAVDGENARKRTGARDLGSGFGGGHVGQQLLGIEPHPLGEPAHVVFIGEEAAAHEAAVEGLPRPLTARRDRPARRHLGSLAEDRKLVAVYLHPGAGIGLKAGKHPRHHPAIGAVVIGEEGDRDDPRRRRRIEKRGAGIAQEHLPFRPCRRFRCRTSGRIRPLFPGRRRNADQKIAAPRDRPAAGAQEAGQAGDFLERPDLPPAAGKHRPAAAKPRHHEKSEARAQEIAPPPACGAAPPFIPSRHPPVPFRSDRPMNTPFPQGKVKPPPRPPAQRFTARFRGSRKGFSDTAQGTRSVATSSSYSPLSTKSSSTPSALRT